MTYGEWLDKQGVRISGGLHLGVPLYIIAADLLFFLESLDPSKRLFLLK